MWDGIRVPGRGGSGQCWGSTRYKRSTVSRSINMNEHRAPSPACPGLEPGSNKSVGSFMFRVIFGSLNTSSYCLFTVSLIVWLLSVYLPSTFKRTSGNSPWFELGIWIAWVAVYIVVFLSRMALCSTFPPSFVWCFECSVNIFHFLWWVCFPSLSQLLPLARSLQLVVVVPYQTSAAVVTVRIFCISSLLVCVWGVYGMLHHTAFTRSVVLLGCCIMLFYAASCRLAASLHRLDVPKVRKGKVSYA